jgi:uncharacterized protein
VLRISLEEAACKIRTGGPHDDEADMSRDVWAGVLPMAVVALAPIPDGEMKHVPEYVAKWAST